MSGILELHKESASQAAKIARIHIKKMKRAPGFGEPMIGTIYPLLEPGGEENLFFDVKLIDKEGKDHGYIIVCLSQAYPPIITFTTAGPSLVEMLDQKVGCRSFIPVFYTPVFSVAEDDQGTFLTSIGSQPIFPVDKNKKRHGNGTPFSKQYANFKTTFLKYRTVELKNLKEHVAKNWKSILADSGQKSDSGDSVYIDEEDVPENDYLPFAAAHRQSLPRYHQIPPTTGVNQEVFYSGCGACAWMCLIGYHDTVRTADLLRGTHRGNGFWYEDYQDKVMMALSKHLDTFDSDNGGAVRGLKMKRGYSFIEEYLKHDIINQEMVLLRSGKSLDVIKKYMELYEVPSVIAIAGHYLIAYLVLYDLGENEDHYLRVFTGWYSTYECDQYISSSQLKGVWTLQGIQERTEVELPWTSPDVPAFTETVNGLVMAFRDDNGDVVLALSENGKDFEEKNRFTSSGTSAPSTLTFTNKYLYLAWSEADFDPKKGPLHLKKIALHNMKDEDLPAPRAPDEDADLTPAIAVCKGHLYMVWRSKKFYGVTNLLRTSLENLDRSGRPWPSDLGETLDTAYWKALPIQIVNRPSLIATGYWLYLGYRRPMSGPYEFNLDGLVSRVACIHPDGHIDPSELPMRNDPDTMSGCSLTAMMHKCNVPYCESDITIVPFCYEPSPPAGHRYERYSTQNGEISRFRMKYPGDLVETAEDVARRAAGEQPSQRHWRKVLVSEEQYWPLNIDAKHDVVLGYYVNMKIGPCLFTAWNDASGKIRIRYHSIDRWMKPLSYEGWPLDDAAWPDVFF